MVACSNRGGWEGAVQLSDAEVTGQERSHSSNAAHACIGCQTNPKPARSALRTPYTAGHACQTVHTWLAGLARMLPSAQAPAGSRCPRTGARSQHSGEIGIRKEGKAGGKGWGSWAAVNMNYLERAQQDVRLEEGATREGSCGRPGLCHRRHHLPQRLLQANGHACNGWVGGRALGTGHVGWVGGQDARDRGHGHWQGVVCTAREPQAVPFIVPCSLLADFECPYHSCPPASRSAPCFRSLPVSGPPAAAGAV